MLQQHPVRDQSASTERAHSAIDWVLPSILLGLLVVLAGGAALRMSITVDEGQHIGPGLSYLQKLDMRLGAEHPPLARVLAALPLVVGGAYADYSSTAWSVSQEFVNAFLVQGVFSEWVLMRWNEPVSILRWARMPMLLLTCVLGLVMYLVAFRLGGSWGGLLCLTIYVSTPVFLSFGPLVLTDMPVTLFSLLALWSFATLWRDPTPKNRLLFALALASALLSKFSALALFAAFGAFGLSTRWRPVPGQPAATADTHRWRRDRWRMAAVGVGIAAAIVYAVYLVLSWNQPIDSLLNQVPSIAGRLLMPPWLYLRGLLVILLTSDRPTFILGKPYAHGVWFYFPVLLSLKSPPGFLGLLALAAGVTLLVRRRGQPELLIIPQYSQLLWRVLWVALIVLTGVCLLSRLNIGLRHFTMPLVLLILMLAPLPRMLRQMCSVSWLAARGTAGITVLLALSCIFTAVRAYPHYVPYVNALSLGEPAYVLFGNADLDWNQALPTVRKFVQDRHLEVVNLDMYGLADPVAFVPEARVWNCQMPSASDAGMWAVISANMIMDARNCKWLLQYPHESLAGGSMYAVQLPAPIPPAGSNGGPPVASEHRQFFYVPFDVRTMFLHMVRDPDRLPSTLAELKAQFETAFSRKRKPAQAEVDATADHK